MSVESSVYGAMDAAFGWGWNIFLGRPSPMEYARLAAERAEQVRKAGGGEREVRLALEQQGRDILALEAARTNEGAKGCLTSVDEFVGCAEKVRKVVTVLAVAVVVIVAVPFVARAYREVKKAARG